MEIDYLLNIIQYIYTRRKIRDNTFQVEEREMLDEILIELTNKIRNAYIRRNGTIVM